MRQGEEYKYLLDNNYVANEFIAESYVGGREAGASGRYESHNDRHDRAIRTVALAIKEALPEQKVVFFTNDKESAEQARKEGLEVRSFKYDRDRKGVIF